MDYIKIQIPKSKINTIKNNLNYLKLNNKNINKLLDFIWFVFISLYNFYTKKTHVPHTWRKGHTLTSIYSLSSFLYCVTGFVIILLIPIYPEYFEINEAITWIWQGIISFIGDAYYLGKSSISHSIDRISALIVTYMLLRKYLTISGLYYCHSHYISMYENSNYPMILKIQLILGLLYSFFCLYNSTMGCININKKQFFLYHTLWHTGFPGTALVFHLILFYYGFM